MKKWIQKMHMKKGALHEELHVPKGEKIPKAKLKKAAAKKGIEGKRARLAETLEGLHNKGKKSAHEREVMGGEKGDKKLHKKAVKRHKKEKVEKVMHEFKEGMLHEGSKKGPRVKKRGQALAIALSESRKVGKKRK